MWIILGVVLVAALIYGLTHYYDEIKDWWDGSFLGQLLGNSAKKYPEKDAKLLII